MKLTCGRHQTGPTRVSMAASFSPFFVKDQRLHFDSAKPSREPPKSLSLSLFSFLVSAQEDYDDGGRRSTAFFLPLNSSNRHLFSQNLRAPSSPSTEAAASSSSSSPALSLSHFPSSMSMPSGIHGQLLEVTVIGCNKLRDTEWLSKQDPYVRLEYGSTSYRTRTCTDGHKNPTFQEKFVFTLIEGLRELNAVVWNSNTLTNDDFIGSGKIQLQKVLSQGYDDSSWTLQTKSGRYAGEVKLILHYSNVKQVKNSTPGYAPPTVAPYSTPPMSYAPHYTSPPAAAARYPSTSAYSPSLFPSYPPPPANYSAYAPNPYAPPPQTTAYPSQPYPSAPYPPQTYPPPPQASPYYPPRTYPPPY